MRRPLAIAAAGCCVVAIAALWAGRELRGLSLLVRAADLQGVGRRIADLDTVAVDETCVRVATRAGSLRARVYAPRGTSRQTVLLVSGVHPGGIDEPRLRALARTLAEANVTVVTPEIAELARFEITPAVTDRIEDAAVWLAASPQWTPSRRIGLMGMSFSGGLAMVAAGREGLRGRLRYVLALGGHDDAARVLQYWCSVDGDSDVRAPAPHDYAVAIVLLNVADRLVPAEQVDGLRAAVRRFLWASYLDRVDRHGAAREFAAVRALVPALPEPARTLVRCLVDRDVARLGARLRPHVGDYIGQAALSPARSPLPSVPVYLLHGRDDTVIPASESSRLAARLNARVPVRLLVTDVISHAEVARPPRAIDVARLTAFWSDLLAR